MWPTLALVAVATVTDLRSRRIPNWLVLPFLTMGPLISGLMRGWWGIGQSFLGLLVATSIMGLFCYLGAMGMGDLKLCAAVGAWIGPAQEFSALLIMAIAGAVMAIIWVLVGGFVVETVHGMSQLLSGFRRRGLRPHETLVLQNPLTRKMPYAPAIAVGTVLSFWSRV